MIMMQEEQEEDVLVPRSKSSFSAIHFICSKASRGHSVFVIN